MAEKVLSFLRGNSFLKGCARVLDMGCTIDRERIARQINSKDPYEGLRKDWFAVGRDIKNAMDNIKNEERIIAGQ
jgi:hypothetical protein